MSDIGKKIHTEVPNFVNPSEVDYLIEACEPLDKIADVINVGVYKGCSGCALLEGMKKYSITGVLHLIDVYKLVDKPPPLNNEGISVRSRDDIEWTDSFFEEAKRNVLRFNSNQRFNMYQEYSDDVNINKKIAQASLIFIDGDHSTQGALLDILKYSQIIIKGGYILMHDSQFPTVDKAIEIFLSIREDFEVVDKFNTIKKIRRKI